MKISSRRSSAFLASIALALGTVACGDDNNAQAPADTGGEAGAGQEPFPEPLPPAIGPEDCSAETSELVVTQPAGADVWGGLTLLEFEVEGSNVDQFDVQYFDPATGAWQTTYSSYFGQREDGSYVLGVSIMPNEAAKDGDFKLRVRPAQSGCPDSSWMESDTFNLGNPFAGSSWRGTVPAARYSGFLSVTRTATDTGLQTYSQLSLAEDVVVDATFDEDGTFTQTTTIALASEAGEPFNDCTVAMTFTGKWSIELGRYGSSLMLDQVMLAPGAAGTAGSSCEFPAVSELSAASDEYELIIGAMQLSTDIDYLPTLYQEPGAPTWNASNLLNAFNYLPSVAGFSTPDEAGYIDGNLYTSQMILERRPPR